jgi:hypothetical protein
MLIKIRFRFPELFLGMLLAVALFALGVVFESSRHQPSQEIPSAEGKEKNNSESEWSKLGNWLFNDATGIFTLGLVIVGGVQIAVFLRQLRLIRESLTPAKDAAFAARDSANAQREEFVATHRPRVRLKHLWLKNNIWAGEKIILEPTLVNYGTAEGTGAEIGLKIHNHQGGPISPQARYFPGYQSLWRKIDMREKP